MQAGWFLAILLALASCKGAGLVDGTPLAVRNPHPAQLTAMVASARPPRALPRGSIEVEAQALWSSLWLRPGGGNDRIELDGELVRLTPLIRCGLGNGFELSLATPFLHAGGGQLDGFLEGWHDAFTLPQNERNLFDRGRFVVRADRQTPSGLETAWELDRAGLAIQDLPIELAWFPFGLRADPGERDGSTVDSDEPWSLGFRLGVELPTGDEDRGLGNGGLDSMLGFVAGYQVESHGFFLWGGHSWVARPSSAARVGLPWGDPTVLGAGTEIAVVRDLSFLAQVEWETSVLRALDETHAKRDQVLLWLGGRWSYSERGSVEVSVGEDLVRSVSPDVTFGLTARWRF